MGEYTTCAVYHRMLAGSLRRKQGLQNLADLASEKMEFFVDEAKKIAVEEYGEELGEEMFLDEWRAELAYMTDQINRNYENISRLKFRYNERCSAILN